MAQDDPLSPSDLDEEDLSLEDLVRHCEQVASGRLEFDADALRRIHHSAPESLDELHAFLARSRPARKDPPQIGVASRFGSYRVIRVVGSGGMGTVYEAEDPSLGRRVAVKVMRVGRGSLKRFRREAQVLARLRHPGIVQVYECGEEKGLPYLAMEFLEGLDLGAVLRRARANDWQPVEISGDTPDASDVQTAPLTEDEGDSSLPAGERKSVRRAGRGKPVVPGPWWIRHVVTWVRDAANTLDYAHERGIIHRDVKPSNLFVCRNGRVKVMDLGLARDLDAQTITRSKDFLGTPQYMSPEQIYGKRSRVEKRTDVYSLGVTLYELISGRFPYQFDSLQELYRKIAVEEPGGLGRFLPHAFRDLETVVSVAMAKNPRRRYATACALADDLQAVLDHKPVRARHGGTGRKVRGWVRRHRQTVLNSVLGLVLALTCFGAFLWLTREDDDRERRRSEPVVDPRPEPEGPKPDVPRPKAKSPSEVEPPRPAVTPRLRFVDIREVSAHPVLYPLQETLSRAMATKLGESVQGEVLQEADPNATLDRLALSGDGSLVAAVLRENTTSLVALFRKKESKPGWRRVRNPIRVPGLTALAISPQGQAVAWGTDVGDVSVLHAPFDGDPVTRRLHTRPVRALALPPEGAVVFSAGADGRVIRHDGSRETTLWTGGPLTSLVRCPETERLYAGVAGGSVIVLGAASGERLDTLDEAAETATDLHLVQRDLLAVLRETGLVEILAAAGDHLGERRVLGSFPNAGRLDYAPRSRCLLLTSTPGEFCAIRLPENERILKFSSPLLDGAFVGASGEMILASAAETTFGLLSVPEFVLDAASGLAVDAEDTPELEGFVSGVEVEKADLDRYRRVDDALAEEREESRNGELLVAADAEWLVFRGEREPPVWMLLGFGDDLKEGWKLRSGGFGFGPDGQAGYTTGDAKLKMENRYTTLFLRHEFHVDRPLRFAGLVLRVRADDGFVAYLNGTEVVRVRAGKPAPPGRLGTPVSFDDVADAQAPEPLRTVERRIAPGLLLEGKNVLGVVGLNRSRESADFCLIPELRGYLPPTYEGESEVAESLRKYLAGRRSQEAGRMRAAADKFREITRQDRTRPEPHQRLAECLIAAGRPQDIQEAGSLLRKALNLGLQSVALEDLRWLLEALAHREVVRINCGGTNVPGTEGAWGRDAFFAKTSGGAETYTRSDPGNAAGREDDGVYGTARTFPVAGGLEPAYRIPLPPGVYEVTLHLAELEDPSRGAKLDRPRPHRTMDVYLEGRRVIHTDDPVEVTVLDGWLEISLVGYCLDPGLAGIEIERLDQDPEGENVDYRLEAARAYGRFVELSGPKGDPTEEAARSCLDTVVHLRKLRRARPEDHDARRSLAYASKTLATLWVAHLQKRQAEPAKEPAWDENALDEDALREAVVLFTELCNDLPCPAFDSDYVQLRESHHLLKRFEELSGKTLDWPPAQTVSVSEERTRGEPVPFSSLARHMNCDVVATKDEQRNADTLDGRSALFLDEKFASSLASDFIKDKSYKAKGLPADRRVGVHKLGDYREPNAIQAGPRDREPVRVVLSETERAKYCCLRFVVAGGHNDSEVPVVLEYVHGDPEPGRIVCDDWFDENPEPGAGPGDFGFLRPGVTPILDGLNRLDRRLKDTEGLDTRAEAALFEVVVVTRPDAELIAFTLDFPRARYASPVTRFNLLAVTGMKVEPPASEGE